ncbi:14631_t:CDS:2, partial [Cetraspora pellucida]
AMNIQTSHMTGKSPYSLVFGQDPVQHFSILEDLYYNDKNIVNEEDLPSNFFEDSEEALPNIQSHHQLSRKYANESFANYRERMKNQMLKKNKHQLEYAINEYVCIAITKIDHNNIDQHTLPCKVIEELLNKMYCLQCKNGILNIAFNANELMPLEPTKYEELEVCENNAIS